MLFSWESHGYQTIPPRYKQRGGAHPHTAAHTHSRALNAPYQHTRSEGLT